MKKMLCALTGGLAAIALAPAAWADTFSPGGLDDDLLG